MVQMDRPELPENRRPKSSETVPLDKGTQLSAAHSRADLLEFYRARFAGRSDYRQRVWSVLSKFFSRWASPESHLLDLGCGWCEFINSVDCRVKFGMDLNPDSKRFANPEVHILEQDCSLPWELEAESLDIVFTSNFLEHLPSKAALQNTLLQVHRTLRTGGRFIAMGPNIRCVPGAYWDFFDHYLPLTELSLIEILEKCGFQIEFQRARFLPYTMSRGKEYPVWMLRVYLSVPAIWRLVGAQFLVVARKTSKLQSDSA
jgi:SAM-dependent methyltransferase